MLGNRHASLTFNKGFCFYNNKINSIRNLKSIPLSRHQEHSIPFLFSIWNLAPISSRYFTVSSLQLSMALLKGVELLIDKASIVAPDLTSSSTMSCWPAWHAKWSGVHRKLSVALTFALYNTTDALINNFSYSKHWNLKESK